MDYSDLVKHMGHQLYVEVRTEDGEAVLCCSTCRDDVMAIPVRRRIDKRLARCPLCGSQVAEEADIRLDMERYTEDETLHPSFEGGQCAYYTPSRAVEGGPWGYSAPYGAVCGVWMQRQGDSEGPFFVGYLVEMSGGVPAFEFREDIEEMMEEDEATRSQDPSSLTLEIAPRVRPGPDPGMYHFWVTTRGRDSICHTWEFDGELRSSSVLGPILGDDIWELGVHLHGQVVTLITEDYPWKEETCQESQ